jgi:hypothetical protein
MATVTASKTWVSGEVVNPEGLNLTAAPTVVVADNEVTTAKIADANVTTAKIADANVTTAKIADGNVTAAKLSQPLTFETVKATTSGTSIDFTGIPSWVKRITVILNQVSTNGTDGAIIQLGDAGGFETTGYLGTGSAITGTNACGVSSVTNGFNAGPGVLASASRSGCVFLLSVSGNTWVASGAVTNGATANGVTAGVKVLSDTLDRVRLTTIGGTDTFDNGSVNIAYE